MEYSKMSLIGFFDNARTFLELEVLRIARKRGYIGKEQVIDTENLITVDGKVHHLTFQWYEKKSMVVITNCNDFCEINDLVLFPAKQKYAKLAKTIAETVVSRLFEE
jgi:hypothetical protein